MAWPFPTPMRAWLEALGLGRLGGRTDFLIGSVLLLNAKALTDVGRFDERFFLYAEETDWQRRASDLGWGSGCAPTPWPPTSGRAPAATRADRDTHFHASNERYLRKHYGPDRVVGLPHRRADRGVVRALVLRGDRGREAATRFRLYLRGPLRAEAEMGGA